MKDDIVIEIKTNKTRFLNEKTILSFNISNNSNQNYSFCYWQTPFEKDFMANYLDVIYKSKKIKYRGRMVKRSPPSDKDYILIKPNSTISSKIEIDQAYDISGKSEYSIQFIGSSINQLPNSNIYKINNYLNENQDGISI